MIFLFLIWLEINIVYLKVLCYDDFCEVGLGSGSWVDLGYVILMLYVDDFGLIKFYDVISKGIGIYYFNFIFVLGNVMGIEMNFIFSGVYEVRVYYFNGIVFNLIYENMSIIGNNFYISNLIIMRGLLRYIILESFFRKNFNFVIMFDVEYGFDLVLYVG